MNKLTLAAVIEHRSGDPVTTTFARNLIRVRSEGGLSQSALAQLSGISNAAVSRIESGMSDPTLSTVVALARALDRGVDELLKP